MKKQKEACHDVAVVEAKPVEPTLVVAPLGKIEEPAYTKPSERINYHISMGQHHGRLALAHLMKAGWELLQQKNVLGYGGWTAWCKEELQVSQKTADRYITFFSLTVGKVRAKHQIPLANRVTNKELDTATVGMDGKSATRAMVDLGIIKHKDWGGDRREKAAENGHVVGRPKKNMDADADVVSKLKAIATSETLLWASAKGALDTLVKLDAEKDFMHRLSDKHLSELSGLLSDLAKKAGELLANRLTV